MDRAAFAWTQTASQGTSRVASSSEALIASMSTSWPVYVPPIIRSIWVWASASHEPTWATRSRTDQSGSRK